MPDIVNLQRKFPVDTDAIRVFTEKLQDILPRDKTGAFAVAFISDGRMKQLNQFFRGKGDTTDVLSFPHEPDQYELTAGSAGATASQTLGDIVISVEQARRQAAENGLTLEDEIKQLILHGVLHLCGYDHETDDGEMNTYELELRDKLGI